MLLCKKVRILKKNKFKRLNLLMKLRFLLQIKNNNSKLRKKVNKNRNKI